ncbi:hypothetical protein [Pseudobacteriovorax antillogorgiicola]|uniref:Uncharacterized protein n=1 Tax=Pseudobacteriovorax antillogorgiicola TaxID=1513793 RepID=A0A1Y6B716_9BACT|nr:hypothetical protein [Pseudobacteriovorax antillogorgiicola]TCS59512.1 hypothetical protein EDD56_101432 [Pseudobacteriovorax antillogorgiicola]SME87879.1 hypothetical protein SAMN06296036_10153 [Pseudobacteriovorax antillogorgiicola]
MDWNVVKVPEGSKLYRIHKFTYMHSGVNYLLEINEDGSSWIGHGEHATDKNSVIPSVNGKSVEDCLNQLISSINSRG